MLKLHFLNVGDGDAMLLEQFQGERVFRVLIDAGRDVFFGSGGSLRLHAAEHLEAMGIRHLDAVVITHLHIDHFGGLRALLMQTAVDRLYAGYFPDPDAEAMDLSGCAAKAERGLGTCLNHWLEDVRLLRQNGTELVEIRSTCPIPALPGLELTLITPDPQYLSLQRETWDRLYHGQIPADGTVYRSAKSRNPGSLRVRLTYAGREAELSGDCYGELWQDTVTGPCHIWKLPHHGDAKSVTESLVNRLRPEYAVISCGKNYIAHKDRPSAHVYDWLTAVGSRVFFTDSFSMHDAPPVQHRTVQFEIGEDGSILTKE